MGMTILTMCLIQSAITIVTTSIALKFWMGPSSNYAAIAVLLMAASILYYGKYDLLDKVMKFAILILTATTIIAVSAVLFKAPGGFHEAPRTNL